MGDKKLNDYEKSIEDNSTQFTKASSKTTAKVERIIKKANKKRNISLRVNGQDLDSLKLKAEKEGIPYQTLLSSIIHKFVNDRLVDEKSILKTFKLIKATGGL